MIHESAWAVVDGLAGNRHIVGVHHAVGAAKGVRSLLLTIIFGQSNFRFDGTAVKD
jgi:hypothetical protein